MSVDHPDWYEPKAAGNMQVVAAISETILAGNGTVNGPYDVSAFEQILVEVSNSNGLLSHWVPQWVTSVASPSGTGFSSTYNSTTNATVLALLDTQSPALTLTINNDDITNGSWAGAIYGFPTSRDRSLVLPPSKLALVSASIANGASQVGAFGLQIPGGATMSVNCSGAGARSQLDVWSGAAWQGLAYISASAINLGTTTKVVLPFSDCRLSIFNFSGGVATVQGAIIAPD